MGEYIEEPKYSTLPEDHIIVNRIDDEEQLSQEQVNHAIEIIRGKRNEQYTNDEE